MSKLARIDAEHIMAGLQPSLPNRTSTLWNKGQNIIFHEQSIQPALGHVPIIGGTGRRITHLQSNRIDTVPTLFWGDRVGLYSWSERAGVAVRGGPYTGDDCDQWQIVNWGRQVVATNGVDPVQVFDPALGIFIPLTGTTFSSADILVRRNPFLIAMNLSSSGPEDFGDTSIAWSDADNINSWLSTPGNLAGDFFVRDMESEIVAGLPLGDDIVFYGTDSMHRLVFRGAPNVFGVERLLEGVGPVGKHAVTEVRRMHYGFSKKGIFATNGFEYEFIDKPVIHDYIYNNINCDPKVQSGFVAWNDENEEHVVFFYADETSETNNKCVAFNYRDNNWTIWNIDRTAAENVSVFNDGITADHYGNIFFQAVSPVTDTANAAPFRICSEIKISADYGDTLYGATGYGGIGEATHNPLGKACERRCLPGGKACGQVIITEKCLLTNRTRNIPTLSESPDVIQLESKDLDFGTNLYLKTLEKVRVEIDPDQEGELVGELALFVGTRDELCDEVIWDGPYEVQKSCPINLRLTAKYFRVRLEATRNLKQWQISAIDFFGSVTRSEQ